MGTWSTYGDTHHYYRICTVCGHKTDVFGWHTYNESDTVYELIFENGGIDIKQYFDDEEEITDFRRLVF